MRQRSRQIFPDNLEFGNAAGTVKTLADVARMCRSAATRITVGSITVLRREGNVEAGKCGVYYYDPEKQISGNARGLNNMGLDEFLGVAPQMIALAHAASKKLIVSIAGNSIEEIVQLVITCLSSGVDGVEINFGCPNVHDDGHQHAIFACEPKLFGNALNAIKMAFLLRGKSREQIIGAKVSTVADRRIVTALSNLIWQTDCIDEIIAVNTDPNHRFTLPDGTDALSYHPPGSDQLLHVGGMAGAPLRPIRREVVRIWRELQPSRKIIAVGGIFTGNDVFEAIDEDGADGFECATAYLENGERIFSDILEGYVARHSEVFGGALSI